MPGSILGCIGTGDLEWGWCCPLGWGDQGAPPHPFHTSLLQEKLKPGYLEQLPGKLKLFSNFLGDRKWFAGEKVPAGWWWGLGEGLCAPPRRSPCPPPQLTFVDFLMFDVLEQNRIFEPKCLEPFKNLKDFMDRFGVSWPTAPTPWGRTPAPEGTLRWGGGSSSGVAPHVPDPPHVPAGSGEGGCLHEVQPLPEDAHQQQDGQVGQQERVGCSAGQGGILTWPETPPRHPPPWAQSPSTQ